MKSKKYVFPIVILVIMALLALGVTVGYKYLSNDKMTANTYRFPYEDQEHEGTWITWPHSHTYGKKYTR